MNDTETDLDLTVLEDLDFEPPCDSLHDGKYRDEHPAEFFVLGTCGCERLWCASSVRNNRSGKWRCAFCGNDPTHMICADPLK